MSTPPAPVPAQPASVASAVPAASPPVSPTVSPASLPAWARELAVQYESGATSQFILTGDVHDRFLLPAASGISGAGRAPAFGSLSEYLIAALMPRFDVVLSYDLGNGLRCDKGGELFAQWPRFRELQHSQGGLPRAPREAIEVVSQYLRFVANLGELAGMPLPPELEALAEPLLPAATPARPRQVGVLIRAADLVAPNVPGGGYELSAVASLIRDWAGDARLAEHGIATFLIADNRNDLHPLIVANPKAHAVRIPLPDPAALAAALAVWAPSCPVALREQPDLPAFAAQLSGTTLHAVDGLLRTRQHRQEPIRASDLAALTRSLVEADCGGLIDFLGQGADRRTLDDLAGQDALKRWLRQDFALWRAGDLAALPMGYLLCGPVGTGKTYLVDCLAGEAGVPVVKLKNFRDKWVGSTEGNLEKIFRLVHALGRAIVFVDEADQALGRRDAGSNDSGVGGRVYGMMAEEMSNTRNRGRILWVLASSRPDLIEVDLKRPGRIDMKIPIFPTTTKDEGLRLLTALCARRSLRFDDAERAALLDLVPDWLTPGAAEALSVKAYRLVRTESQSPLDALRACLTGYQPPVARSIIEAQIRLAVDEATDLSFVPESLRRYRS